MATTTKQRYISTSFWDDEWVHSLKPLEKMVYLYLLTNPLTNIAGVYKIMDQRICFDIGLGEKEIAQIIQKFENAGKAYRMDEYIVIPTWPKHQQWEKRPTIRDGIVGCLQDLNHDYLKKLDELGYQFDLSTVQSTVIARKQRDGISGAKAKKVFEKCGNACTKCGSTEHLVIAHIKPIKNGGSNDAENLTVLCEECFLDGEDTPESQNPYTVLEIVLKKSGEAGFFIDPPIALKLIEEVDNSWLIGDHSFMEMAAERSRRGKYAEKSEGEQKGLYISALLEWDDLRQEYPRWKAEQEKLDKRRAIEEAEQERQRQRDMALHNIPAQCPGCQNELNGATRCPSCGGFLEFDEETFTYSFTPYTEMESIMNRFNDMIAAKGAT
jgi:hypothetical protein